VEQTRKLLVSSGHPDCTRGGVRSGIASGYRASSPANYTIEVVFYQLHWIYLVSGGVHFKPVFTPLIDISMHVE